MTVHEHASEDLSDSLELYGTECVARLEPLLQSYQSFLSVSPMSALTLLDDLHNILQHQTLLMSQNLTYLKRYYKSVF